MQIMSEVHRVLKPGGYFLFSTHNKNCPDSTAIFKLPEVAFSPNPVRLAFRLARAVRRTPLRLMRRLRMRRHEVRNSEFAMINDVCHDYGVMLYYITLDKQRLQLEKMGFSPDAEAFALDGNDAGVWQCRSQRLARQLDHADRAQAVSWRVRQAVLRIERSATQFVHGQRRRTTCSGRFGGATAARRAACGIIGRGTLERGCVAAVRASSMMR